MFDKLGLLQDLLPAYVGASECYSQVAHSILHFTELEIVVGCLKSCS